MAGTLFQDNLSPYLTVVEQGSTPATPSAGNQKLFIRTSDHLLCYVNSSGTVTPVGGAGSGSITSSGYTQNTARLLGRTTASAGAIEEITVGSGLTLSAGSLTASGSSGALTLLEQHTASSSATLDFTTFYSSTYDDYLIELLGIIPATNNVSLQCQVSTDGGSTWDSSSNYYSALVYTTNGGSPGGAVFANPGGAWVIATGINTLARRTLQASLRLGGLASANGKTMQGTMLYTNQTALLMGTLGNFWDVATAANALQFSMSAGNIASGTIRVYGLAK